MRVLARDPSTTSQSAATTTTTSLKRSYRCTTATWVHPSLSTWAVCVSLTFTAYGRIHRERHPRRRSSRGNEIDRPISVAPSEAAWACGLGALLVTTSMEARGERCEHRRGRYEYGSGPGIGRFCGGFRRLRLDALETPNGPALELRYVPAKICDARANSQTVVYRSTRDVRYGVRGAHVRRYRRSLRSGSALAALGGTDLSSRVPWINCVDGQGIPSPVEEPSSRLADSRETPLNVHDMRRWAPGWRGPLWS
jgi:hypothetical protein